MAISLIPPIIDYGTDYITIDPDKKKLLKLTLAREVPTDTTIYLNYKKIDENSFFEASTTTTYKTNTIDFTTKYDLTENQYYILKLSFDKISYSNDRIFKCIEAPEVEPKLDGYFIKCTITGNINQSLIQYYTFTFKQDGKIIATRTTTSNRTIAYVDDADDYNGKDSTVIICECAVTLYNKSFYKSKKTISYKQQKANGDLFNNSNNVLTSTEKCLLCKTINKKIIPIHKFSEKEEEEQYTDLLIDNVIQNYYGLQFDNDNKVCSYTKTTVQNSKDNEYAYMINNNENGIQVLTLPFNFSVSSFKQNIPENKIESLNQRFPSIVRNDIVRYYEFPISGLIAYESDRYAPQSYKFNNTIFSNDILSKQNSRTESRLFIDIPYEKLDHAATFSADNTYYEKDSETGQYKIIENTSGNFNDKRDSLYLKKQSNGTVNTWQRDEIAFKQQAIEFFYDGKPKILVTPTEGMFLVQLTNITFTPEPSLNRVLYNFSCTATQIGEINAENLSAYGFSNVNATATAVTPATLYAASFESVANNNNNGNAAIMTLTEVQPND